MLGLIRLGKVGEGVGQRGGSKHRECSSGLGGGRGVRAAAACQHRHSQQHSHKTAPHGLPTITEVALTVATALTPGRSPSSSTASRVTIETMWWGPAWISTCAITPVTSTLLTTPSNLLRAEKVGSTAAIWCPPRRVISLWATTRRLAESRRIVIRPARSQRRSVSTLTPSARAASPTGSIRSMATTLTPRYYLCKI